jgi:hypothetical protein
MQDLSYHFNADVALVFGVIMPIRREILCYLMNEPCNSLAIPMSNCVVMKFLVYTDDTEVKTTTMR